MIDPSLKGKTPFPHTFPSIIISLNRSGYQIRKRPLLLKGLPYNKGQLFYVEPVLETIWPENILRYAAICSLFAEILIQIEIKVQVVARKLDCDSACRGTFRRTPLFSVSLQCFYGSVYNFMFRFMRFPVYIFMMVILNSTKNIFKVISDHILILNMDIFQIYTWYTLITCHLRKIYVFSFQNFSALNWISFNVCCKLANAN